MGKKEKAEKEAKEKKKNKKKTNKKSKDELWNNFLYFQGKFSNTVNLEYRAQ